MFLWIQFFMWLGGSVRDTWQLLDSGSWESGLPKDTEWTGKQADNISTGG